MQRAAGIQNPNMKFFRLVLTLLVLILFSAITNSTLLDYSRLSSFTRADASDEQSAFDKREAAYRANNLGVRRCRVKHKHRPNLCAAEKV